jgi:hypothetical protein
MGYANQVQALAMFAAIGGLLLAGFLISLASGTKADGGRHPFWYYVGNFCRVAIRIFAYLAGLLALQEMIGFPLDALW